VLAARVHASKVCLAAPAGCVFLGALDILTLWASWRSLLCYVSVFQCMHHVSKKSLPVVTISNRVES
jgi:hypothetical protein